MTATIWRYGPTRNIIYMHQKNEMILFFTGGESCDAMLFICVVKVLSTAKKYVKYFLRL